jgi:hypothetical protein
MILLLGYLASLFSTFVISAAMLSAILTVTTANKAPGHSYRSHMVQLSKHEPNKHRANSGVARATAKDKSTSVMADAGRLPEIAGTEVEKLRRLAAAAESLWAIPAASPWPTKGTTPARCR